MADMGSAEGGAGAGAREVHARLVAARLRKLKAAGATNDELIAALDEGPAHERSWAVGAEGEAAVAGVLNEWAGLCGFGVVHDLAIPGSRANIDHVVVGPGGVAVIDTKKWSAPVRVTPRTLRVGSWSKRRELEAIGGQVRLVREVLARGGVVTNVAGALCLANRNLEGPGRVQTIDGIRVGGPEAIAEWAARGAVLQKTEAEEALVILVSHFRPREVIEVGDMIVEAAAHQPARPVSAHPTVAPPRPRWSRPTARFWRLASWCGGAAVLLAILGSFVKPPIQPPSKLSNAEVSRLRVDLRARASTAAGGPVRGPNVQVTDRRVHLRYRRGDCRVHISLNRATAHTANDGVVQTSGSCPHL